MNNFQQEAKLLKLSFQQMYLQKGRDAQPHRELHAANLLESESEWCTRRYVLMNLYPDEVQKPELKSWDWKREDIYEHGWEVHRKWQYMFRMFGNVVLSDDNRLPELDLTHFLPDENLYFSPDAIIQFGNEKYLVEIKGIKQEVFLKLTDDLMQAITVPEADVVRKARIQANNYLFFTDLQKAILLIENKNNQDFKIYVMERDYDLFKPYEFRVDEINGNTYMVKNHGIKMLSDRVCHSPQDKLAQQCPMRSICFSERLEEEYDDGHHS